MIKNKKGAFPLLILIAAVILIGAFATGFINLGAISGSGDYIQRPVFKYVKCEQIGSLKYSTFFDLSSNGEWLYKPSVTDEYNVIIEFPSLRTSTERLEYYINYAKALKEEYLGGNKAESEMIEYILSKNRMNRE